METIVFEEVSGGYVAPGTIPFRRRVFVLQCAAATSNQPAYNGAGQLLSSATNLSISGSIVSVEARHASIIRELRYPGSAAFAGDDVIDPMTGLERALKPAEVLPQAKRFINEDLQIDNLPTA